jgi:uncharacterized protein (TIGR02391 family)
MKLINLIPDPDVLCALEPGELSLRMLPALATFNEHYGFGFLSLHRVLDAWVGGQQPGEYPVKHAVWVEEAVREAWALLEGAGLLILAGNGHTKDDRLLSRRARQLAVEPDARKVFMAARRIPKESLHKSIREDVWALYHRGKYDTAVFEAMKAVEVAVRDAAELTPKDVGVNLMRMAFHPTTGRLTDKKVDVAEREACANLFAGAIGSYKNPQSHRKVSLDDPSEAAEIIMIANHLLRIVDARWVDANL